MFTGAVLMLPGHGVTILHVRLKKSNEFGSISRPTCSIALSYSYLEHFTMWWNDMYVHPTTIANEPIDYVHCTLIFI
jgi:hypothetical protein